MKSFIKAVLVWAVLSASVSSCKKTTETGTPPPPTDSPSTYLLDSTVYILKDTNLATGVFHYSVGTQSLPHFKKGDFIIEPRNFGYLRKIDDLKLENGDMYFYTEQATINDAFKRYGDFKVKFIIPGSMNPFSFASRNSKRSKIAVNSVSAVNGSPAILDVAPDYTISIPGLDLTFKRFSLNFNPVFNTSYSAQNKSFSLGLDSTPVSWNYDVAFQKASDGVLTTTDTFHLQNYFPANISNLFTRVPIEAMGPNGIPLIGDVRMDLLCILSYSGSNALSEEFAVSQQRGVTMNMIYQNAQLDSKFQYSIPFNEDFNNVIFSNLNGMDASVSIIPVYKFSFYNTFLTNISLSNKMSIGVESNTNPIAWDERAQVSVQGTIDFDNSILGFSDKSETKTSFAELADTVYTAPARITSTGSITGKPGDNIPYSIELQDSRGVPILFPTSVYYTTDNGSWDNSVLLSSASSGSVTNNFTLGTGSNNTQILVKDAKNNVLASLNSTFVSSDTVTSTKRNLVAIGPYPVPGLIPGFAGNPASTYVASGTMVFPTNSLASFYVEIFDGSNVNLYSGNAVVNYYGHDNGGQPYFVATDSSYVGAQFYTGQGWGCMMPPGFEIFFTIGSDSYVGDNTRDGKTVLLLPAGYCIFQ